MFAVRSRHYGFWAFIEIYWVFPRLPFGIVAYVFTLFWTTFVETAVDRRIIPRLKDCCSFRGLTVKFWAQSLSHEELSSSKPEAVYLFYNPPINFWNAGAYTPLHDCRQESQINANCLDFIKLGLDYNNWDQKLRYSFFFFQSVDCYRLNRDQTLYIERSFYAIRTRAELLS